MKKVLLYAFLLLCTVQVYAQEHSVSGKVTDAGDGVGLPGVNVVIQGTTMGVATDADGNYAIVVPNNDVSLIFSFLGFKNKVVAVGSQTTINAVLAQELSQLNEVVVIGYGSVKRKDLTGAVVSLGDGEMTGGAATTSAAQMIQGRAAGVEVSANDGEPGQGMNILIRGNTSITNGTQPLYVVDGFPLAAGVSISPEDIETIDILKDAASAAIYGSRGSSGVILITTKKGRTGRTEISYNGYTGVQSMNGSVEYLGWKDQARITNEQYADGPNDGNPWFDAADIASPNNTNWLDEVTRDAKIQNHTFRASGGDDKSHFSISANYFDQEGIFLSSNFQRASVRLNVDRKFGDKTKVGVNAYVARVDADAMDKRPGSRTLSPLYATLRASAGRAAYNDDGTLATTAFSRDTREFRNPIGFFTERENNYVEWRTYTNLYVSHNITEDLVAKISLGFDHTAGNNSRFEPAKYSSQGPSWGQIVESKNTSVLTTATLDYKFSMLPEDHSLSVMAGTERQANDFYSFNLFGSGFPTDKTSFYNLGSATNQTIQSYKEDSRIISFFGRASYSYKDKYLFTGTVRADADSKFGANNAWATFPSASLAWKVSEEDFLSTSDVVSDLKVRLSYGITGNNSISPYTSLQRVGASNTYSYDGSSFGAGLGTDGNLAPNPNLKWETTSMLNIGFDFGLWNDRLYGSLEVYSSNTDDLLIIKSVSAPSTGFQGILENIGSMKNTGVELSLGGKVLESNGFKWTANANFSKNKNEITALDGDNPIFLRVVRQPYGEITKAVYRRIAPGLSMGNFYGYTFKGILQEGETYAAQPNTTKPGSALYEDINNDGIIDSDDRSVIGNANPDFILGFNNHFEYKGVYLDMFWQAAIGNDIFNFKAVAADRVVSSKAADRYSSVNKSGTRPGADWFAGEYGTYMNTEFIEDGSYGRLKNLSLGYNINTESISWLQNLNVYVQGQNLVTLTKYSGYDPEVSFNYNGTQSSVNRGVDDYGYPNYKTYTLGIKATF